MTRPRATGMGRSRRSPWRRVPGLVAGIGLALAIPALVLAHPLGNFTVNHYAGIRIEPDRLILDVVIDQAEIPTFQEKLRIDTDGDGSVSDAEAEVERVAACPVLAPSLTLTVAGRALPLQAVAAGLSFPPGAAGLETMRLVCTFVVALPAPLAGPTPITFVDASHPGRIGWHEIVAEGSGVTLAESDARPTSPSARLTAYPTDMLKRPLAMMTASIVAVPGGPTLDPFSVPDAAPLPGLAPLWPVAAPAGDASGTEAAGEGSATAGPPAAPNPAAPGPAVAAPTPGIAATGGSPAVGASVGVPGGVGAEISGLLEARDLTPLVVLGSLAAALALGAGHALTPGHGKTLMGAYLVGTRGTPVHAVALGLSVTVSHTLGIVVLAAVVVGLRGVLPPETFNRWAPLASGLLVLAIGGWLLIGQARRVRSANGHGDARAGDLDHAHADSHAHPDAAVPAIAADGYHDHGGPRHRHVAASGASLTWRSLFVLGLAGGIIPSTNALIILLATIATGRAAYGLVLVVAFGLGMAVVLGAVGLGLVLARDQLGRLPSSSRLDRLTAFAPVVAGVVVLALGIYLTSQAVGAGPTL